MTSLGQMTSYVSCEIDWLDTLPDHVWRHLTQWRHSDVTMLWHWPAYWERLGSHVVFDPVS